MPGFHDPATHTKQPETQCIKEFGARSYKLEEVPINNLSMKNAEGTGEEKNFVSIHCKRYYRNAKCPEIQEKESNAECQQVCSSCVRQILFKFHFQRAHSIVSAFTMDLTNVHAAIKLSRKTYKCGCDFLSLLPCGKFSAQVQQMCLWLVRKLSLLRLAASLFKKHLVPVRSESTATLRMPGN